MREEKVKELLSELAERTAEPAPPGLAEDIKHQIPATFAARRGGMNTINIIIDLRINKWTAAAVIILTMILLADFFSRRLSPGAGLYQDSKMLVEYLFGASIGEKDLSAVKSRYERLIGKGEEAVFYGDKNALGDTHAVLLYWKVSGGKYKVIFGDLREKTVSADVLVKLQAYMLQKKVE